MLEEVRNETSLGNVNLPHLKHPLPDNIPEEHKEAVEEMARKMEASLDARDGQPKSWKLSDFQVGGPLGRGKFGRVYLARERETGYMVALKTLYKSELTSVKYEHQVVREIEIQLNLKHPNILEFLTYFQDEKRIFLVLEYAAGGDLFGRLQRAKNGYFSDAITAKFVTQVADALEFCHSMDVMHRDIKPENLLLDINDNIKLADFGWSVRAPSNQRKTLCDCKNKARLELDGATGKNRKQEILVKLVRRIRESTRLIQVLMNLAGTLDYLPPEMVQHRTYSSTVDNWCLGVLCYELLTGKPPFESAKADLTYKKILCAVVCFPNHVSKAACSFISALVKKNPDERLPLANVKSHPWVLKSLNTPSP